MEQNDGYYWSHFPNTEMIIVDVQAIFPANGESGEICIKGPQVHVRGYWNRPAVPAEVMMEEWFKSGDIRDNR